MAAKFPKRNYEPRPRRPRPQVSGGRDERRPAGARAPLAGGPPQPAAETAWERQARWYDLHQGDEGDDFYRDLILPTVLRRLGFAPGAKVLDVCCGQGVLGRALAAAGAMVTGVDASPALIAAATARSGERERYVVGDARDLGAALAAKPGPYDHAALVMALQDLDPIAPVLAGVAEAVRPGGRVVMCMTHPCFRIPRRSSWGWDEANGVQFRRIDGYLSPLSAPIKIHPGMEHDTSRTTTFHRPVSAYVNACGDAGLGVVAMDELCSNRRGTKGPRFGAEDRAAKEFPLFLAITAVVH